MFFFHEISVFLLGQTILDPKVSVYDVQLSINFTQKKRVCLFDKKETFG